MSPWLPWLRLPAPATPEPPPSRFGTAALAIAERELGHGESTADNMGPDLDRYRRGGPAGAWCAAFVAFCLEEGARELGLVPGKWPVKRSHSAKQLFANAIAAGAVVITEPAPGDLALWHRGAAGARTGHIALVARGLDDGLWTSIEGNRGRFPSRVRRFAHELGEPLFLGFARLP